MRITVIGCGRWGSLIAWYLDRVGHQVTLYGWETSAHMQEFLKTHSNGLLTLPLSVSLSCDLSEAVSNAETLILSVPSQGLRGLMKELTDLGLENRNLVLCMKGIEIGSGKRLSEIAEENTHSVQIPVNQSISKNRFHMYCLNNFIFSLLFEIYILVYI